MEAIASGHPSHWRGRSSWYGTSTIAVVLVFTCLLHLLYRHSEKGQFDVEL